MVSRDGVEIPFCHVLLYIISILSIGSASILVKLSNASGVACAFWRLSISSIVLGIIYGLWRRGRKRLCGREVVLLLVSSSSLALHLILWMESLFRLPIAVSVTIVVTYPLHLSIAYTVYEKSIRHVSTLLGSIIGFLGILILFRDAFTSATIDIVGVVQSFSASIFAALYFHIGRVLRRSMDLGLYTTFVYGIGAIVVFLYSIFVEENVLSYIPSSWIWFLMLAIIPTIGGHTVMNYLLKFYRSSTVASIALTEPVVATILASVILREPIEFVYLIALTKVLIGLYIVIRYS